MFVIYRSASARRGAAERLRAALTMGVTVPRRVFPDTIYMLVLATRALLGGLLVPVGVLRRGNRAIEPALERGVLGLEGL